MNIGPLRPIQEPDASATDVPTTQPDRSLIIRQVGPGIAAYMAKGGRRKRSVYSCLYPLSVGSGVTRVIVSPKTLGA